MELQQQELEEVAEGDMDVGEALQRYVAQAASSSAAAAPLDDQ